MKDQRFIELVNLYIDRQITVSEAAELEGEIQANTGRRAIYRQYCQMHQATRQVYESFRAPVAAGQESSPAANRSVVAHFDRQPRHSRSRWAYYAGGLAAAACLALVFVRLNDRQPATAASLMANMGKLAPAKAAPAPVAAVSATVAAAARHSPAPETDYTALLAIMRQEDQRAVANGPGQSGRVPSLFDDGIFDTPQIAPANSQRVFRGKQTPVQQTEFTAWQFQR